MPTGPEADDKEKKNNKPIRPLDRKAFLAGREVIAKIQDKLDHEVVSHRGHLKRVSLNEGGFCNNVHHVGEGRG